MGLALTEKFWDQMVCHLIIFACIFHIYTMDAFRTTNEQCHINLITDLEFGGHQVGTVLDLH